MKVMTLQQFAQTLLKAKERFLAIIRCLEKEGQKEILDDAFGMIFTEEKLYRYKEENVFFLFCVVFLCWMKTFPEEQQYLQLDEFQKQPLKSFKLDFGKFLEYGAMTFLGKQAGVLSQNRDTLFMGTIRMCVPVLRKKFSIKSEASDNAVMRVMRESISTEESQ